jgi:hypothetical protein
MAEPEPNHANNYAELNNAHEEARQREHQQENAPEPTRPDQIRSAGWAQSPDMASQNQSAIERNNEINHDWKRGLKDRDYAQKMQQELEQERASQRENEGPQRDHPGARER